MKKTAPLSPMQKENTRHGEQLFPFQQYMTSLSALYPRVSPHWHEEAEWTLITEGEGICQIQLSSFPIREGDFVFIPPAMLHSIYVKEGGFLRSETYVFHLNFLGIQSADVCSVRYLTPLQNQGMIPPFVIHSDHPAYEQLSQIFSRVQEACRGAEPGYELILKAELLLLISALIPYCRKEASPADKDTEQTKKLKTVLEYIDAHLEEDLSIQQLAGLCYFSEYHFMRFFKKYVGLSCLTYIKNLRLEKAASLLMKGGCSTLEISLSAGFHNLSYFHREFKKRYGVTPKEYADIAHMQ